MTFKATFVNCLLTKRAFEKVWFPYVEKASIWFNFRH
jgi:hypothetical protein